jgi:transposase/uncharacterized coiled-coil protein SlyX
MSPVEEKLREELRGKNEVISGLDGQVKDQQATIDKLRYQMDDLLRRLYGRKSEKLDPNQLLMDEFILAADGQVQKPELPEPAEEEPPAKQRKKRKRSGRQPLPDHLPRNEIIISVPEDQKICASTGQPRPFLGYEQSEKLEYIPETLQVNVYKREKYGSPMGAEENGVVTAPVPPAAVERCLADTGMLAHVAVAKFDDHLPLYRQEGILLRQGVQISRKTMAGWLGRVSQALVPLWDRLAELIRECGIVHHDDTPVKMLDPGAGKTKETRLWVSLSGVDPPLMHVQFSTDRRQHTPIEFFSGYTGALMCDEYAGYVNVDCETLLSCWAHARRYVEKAKNVEPAFAVEVLLEIAALYKIEKRIREGSELERQQVRQTESRDQVEKIFALLESREFRPQSPMRIAANYILKRKKQLLGFTRDQRLPIDNNPVERALRRVATGRKNWLHLGSEAGGETAAVFISLLGTCWANQVNSWAYLKDVLDRLPTQPPHRIDELLPHRWIEQNPQARLPSRTWQDESMPANKQEHVVSSSTRG